MKTQTLKISVTPEEALAYEKASPDVQREIDAILRRKLREALRRPEARTERDPAGLDPDVMVTEILELLSNDRYKAARQKAVEAVERFPSHPRVQGVWGIFDPRGKSKAARGAPAPSRRREIDWLRHAPDSFQGKWVALVGDELVGSAETLEELTAALNGKSFAQTPLVHRVD